MAVETSQRKNDKQRTNEWEKLDSHRIKYHTTQWESPKQSTLAFEKFAADDIRKSSNIIDMGAGTGAATAYLAQKYDGVQFTAFDYSTELITIGNEIAANKQVKNIIFKQGDWFNMSSTSEFDGAISLQTLSWLPDYERPLLEIFDKLQPNWIALTSLFYEGDITCRIEVEEHKRGEKQFYNIYSLPAVSRFCESKGHRLKKYIPFEIEIDIEKPNDKDLMGTYTRQAICGNEKGFERLQISGPLLMNWYMLLIEKIT